MVEPADCVREPLIWGRFARESAGVDGVGAVWGLAGPGFLFVCRGVGPGGAVLGRLPLGRHPLRATARARISQFAQANSTCRWCRFLARPR